MLFLPCINKFAFDYLELDKGKYHIALTSRKLEEPMQSEDDYMSMDIDTPHRPRQPTKNDEYTPFMSK
jgi:hypothetical protein